MECLWSKMCVCLCARCRQIPQKHPNLGEQICGSVSVANHWSIKVMSLWLEASFSSRHSPPRLPRKSYPICCGMEISPSFPKPNKTYRSSSLVVEPTSWKICASQIGSNVWNLSHLLEDFIPNNCTSSFRLSKGVFFDGCIENPSNLRINSISSVLDQENQPLRKTSRKISKTNKRSSNLTTVCFLIRKIHGSTNWISTRRVFFHALRFVFFSH